MLVTGLLPALCGGFPIRALASPSGFTATLELLALNSPGTVDTSVTLPDSIFLIEPGATFFLELWAQTPDVDGFAQVSADVSFDPTLMSVTSITLTPLFDLFPSGVIDNVNGMIDNLSGSHTPAIPPCSDHVGTSPNWVRVAVIEMQAGSASGVAAVGLAAANDNTHFVAICGSAVEPAVAFGSLVLGIGAGIPAVSLWGLIVLTLMLLTTATLVMQRFSVLGAGVGVACG